MTTNEYVEKGLVGEKALQQWLDENHFCYLRLSQSPQTYARLFNGHVKRPDFLILLNSIGLIAVDVKNKTDLTLDWKKEVVQVFAFERIFRIPVWYVYRTESDGRVVWRWISALKAVEAGLPREGPYGPFLQLSADDCIGIETGTDLAQLYTHRLDGISRIAWHPSFPTAAKKHQAKRSQSSRA